VQPESSPPDDEEPGTLLGPGSKSPVLPLAPELPLVPLEVPSAPGAVGTQSRIVSSSTLPLSGRQLAFDAVQAPGTFVDVVQVSPEFFPAQIVGASAQATMGAQKSAGVGVAPTIPHESWRHAQVADPQPMHGAPASPPSAHATTMAASHATGALDSA